MAKATKEVEKEEKKTVKKAAKMSRKEAQEIVRQYDGINGTEIEELTEAKEVLSGEGEVADDEE